MKVAIIVGRFQVPYLHEGHMELIEHGLENSDRLIIFVGVSRSDPSSRNPLDFPTRQKMLASHYPDAIILPLFDQESDVVWSKNIDSTVNSLFPDLSYAYMLGGRDNSLDHYYGKFSKFSLEFKNEDVSGTQLRLESSKQPLAHEEFRRGCIYTISRLRPCPIMAVDIALTKQVDDQTYLLLGKKASDTGWRFPGGKVDITDQSLEAVARRELQEETNCFAEHLTYLGSHLVDDWRYRRNPTTKIMTTLFHAQMMTEQRAEAGDDLAEVAWFSVSYGLKNQIIPTHQVLFDMFLKEVKC